MHCGQPDRISQKWLSMTSLITRQCNNEYLLMVPLYYQAVATNEPGVATNEPGVRWSIVSSLKVKWYKLTLNAYWISFVLSTQVILVASSFMTPMDARQGTNLNRVRMFGAEKLSQSFVKEKWDRVKIVCTQPFNKVRFDAFQCCALLLFPGNGQLSYVPGVLYLMLTEFFNIAYGIKHISAYWAGLLEGADIAWTRNQNA